MPQRSSCTRHRAPHRSWFRRQTCWSAIPALTAFPTRISPSHHSPSHHEALDPLRSAPRREPAPSASRCRTRGPQHDAVVIAGDICQGIGEGVRFIAGEGLNAKPVLYVAGNHEFYDRDRHAELARRPRRGRRSSATSICSNATASRSAASSSWAARSWTDYLYAGAGEQARAMQWAAQRLNDHRLIANGTRRLAAAGLPRRAPGLARLARRAARRRSPHPKVVITHHAPSRRSVQPQYRDDLLTAAFASDLDELVGKAALWVHGHMHAPCRLRAERLPGGRQPARLRRHPRGPGVRPGAGGRCAVTATVNDQASSNCASAGRPPRGYRPWRFSQNGPAVRGGRPTAAWRAPRNKDRPAVGEFCRVRMGTLAGGAEAVRAQARPSHPVPAGQQRPPLATIPRRTPVRL